MGQVSPIRRQAGIRRLDAFLLVVVGVAISLVVDLDRIMLRDAQVAERCIQPVPKRHIAMVEKTGWDLVTLCLWGKKLRLEPELQSPPARPLWAGAPSRPSPQSSLPRVRRRSKLTRTPPTKNSSEAQQVGRHPRKISQRRSKRDDQVKTVPP